MSKHIQYYLPLYIGQWCIADGNRFQLRGVDISTAGTSAFTGLIDDNGIPQAWWVENCDFKIELRKLSSLTYNEDQVEFPENNRMNRIDEHWYPEGFLWLLSRGFDLFGLIESGLAIESKPQTN